MRLVRGTNGFAATENDGVTVIDTSDRSSTTILDTALSQGSWYYYTIFILGTDNLWHRAGEVSVFVVRDYGYSSHLWDQLPVIYKTTQEFTNTDSVESSSLQRYLQLPGFELNYLRSILDSLVNVYDVRSVASELLPAFGQQFGLRYEAELGPETMRRLIRGAVRLYSLKGTITGIKELSTIVTGWATDVTIGKNIVLDDLDANCSGSPGRWNSNRVNCRVSARPGDNTISAFAGDWLGDVKVTGNAPWWISVGTPQTARYTGIPIVQGTKYAFSAYLRASATARNVTLTMNWFDNVGELVATSTGDPVVPLMTDWSVRANVVSVAPPGAAFMVMRIDGDGTWQANDHCYIGGIQVEVATSPTSYQCPREIQLFLHADVINWVSNPSGTLAVTNWTDTTGHNDLTQDATDGLGKFVLTAKTGNTSFQVENADRVMVSPGDSWVAAMDVGDPVGHSPLWVTTPVFFLYQGNVLVGTYTPSTLVQIPAMAVVRAGISYVVPDDGSVDGLSVGLLVRKANSSAFTAGDVITFRRVLMTQGYDPFTPYFDGSSSSTTADYLWEGAPNLSRSHFYERRIVKSARLRSLLPSFIPQQTCVEMFFATPQQILIAPDIGLLDYATDPPVPPTPPPVGRSVTLDWKDRAKVGAQVGLFWKILHN